MSVELFNQHEAITELQQTEELLIDQHKAMNEFLAQFLPESRELYRVTNCVDYDQDGKKQRLALTPHCIVMVQLERIDND